MTASGLNALGYQDVPPLPDTRPSAKRAADLLEASVTRNVNDREARELEALQGIGFALLAIAEQLAGDAQPLQSARPRLRWFHRHLNRR
jgi:hypothetical protein